MFSKFWWLQCNILIAWALAQTILNLFLLCRRKTLAIFRIIHNSLTNSIVFRIIRAIADRMLKAYFTPNFVHTTLNQSTIIPTKSNVHYLAHTSSFHQCWHHFLKFSFQHITFKRSVPESNSLLTILDWSCTDQCVLFFTQFWIFNVYWYNSCFFFCFTLFFSVFYLLFFCSLSHILSNKHLTIQEWFCSIFFQRFLWIVPKAKSHKKKTYIEIVKQFCANWLWISAHNGNKLNRMTEECKLHQVIS